MKSKHKVLAASGLGATLLLSFTAFAGCEGSGNGNGTPGATSQSIVPGPFDDPEHPLQCNASGDSAPPAHGVDTPAAITNASLSSTFSPSQVGWFGPPFAPMAAPGTPTCDGVNPTPTVIDSARDVRYNRFAFKNWTNADACISAFAYDDVPPVPHSQMQLAAYVGHFFDPTDILLHNVAASAPADDIHLSFSVPAGMEFEIVVIGAGPLDRSAPTDIQYHLFVTNCGQMPDGGVDGGGVVTSDAGITSDGGSSAADASVDGSTGGVGKTW
jgi:hypothetical protein